VTEEKKAPQVLGVIPARGGSKRLPRKNILPLAGHPLMAWTIMAAQKAVSLTDFLVSSEDEEILSVARRYGAPVPFVRPAELATDEVRNIETVLHALEFMEKERGKAYDMVVLLQPTSPIRDPRHIDEAVRLLWESSEDTLASVKGPFKKRDPILKRIRDGLLEPYCDGKGLEHNEPFYLYNASLYAVKRDYLIRERRLISRRQIPLVMDAAHSVDVDTELDLRLAETYLKYLSLDESRKESL